MDRVILHSDANGFYAGVECLENPFLRDKPVAVCGDAKQRHGIILAKNEIAKRFNIKTGETIWEAKLKCPNLVLVTADFKKYIRYSKIIKSIYDTYTNQVEGFGIDEAWLDVSGLDGKKTADELRERIRSEVGLTVSVGVSWNKIYAKLASDIKKPDATTVITRQNFKDIIFPLAVSNLLYVGRATRRKLSMLDINTIGQLAATDVGFLKQRLGKWGEYLWIYANGLDSSAVASCNQEVVIKSISNSTTAIRDLKTASDFKMIATVLSESVSTRLKEQSLKGQVISLYIKDKNLESWGKQQKIKEPTNLSKIIIDNIMELFRYYEFKNPIRAVGVGLSDLCHSNNRKQLSFFDDKAQSRDESLEQAIYKIRSRFGHFSINRGIEYLDKDLTEFNPKGENVIHPISFLK